MSKKTKEDETIQIKMLGSSPFIKTSRLGRLKRLAERASPSTRADKGWAVKRARPSKKVWCSGLGPYLDLSLVFEFGQGLRCGLSIRHCRCNWIMAAWFVFLHFFLVPLSWYAVSERQMLLFFAEVGVCRQTSLSKGLPYCFHDSTTELYFRSTTL